MRKEKSTRLDSMVYSGFTSLMSKGFHPRSDKRRNITPDLIEASSKVNNDLLLLISLML